MGILPITAVPAIIKPIAKRARMALKKEKKVIGIKAEHNMNPPEGEEDDVA
jgi:hypothetical protein